jgi:hypothetical protein
MTAYTEELYYDPYEALVEDPTIFDDDEDSYDDASFADFLNSGNDF